MIELLEELVAIYSVSKSERDIYNFIIKKLDGVKDATLYNPGDKYIALHIKGNNTKRALIFNGHLDTVPEGDKRLWSNDPLKVTVEGNKAYGLGVSDMKSGLAVMLHLIKYFSKNKPSCDLWFVFVTEEEVDGSGAREFTHFFSSDLQSSYQVINVLVLEPTGLDFVGVGHRGHRMFNINVRGQSGHGSRPYDIERHAIYDALEIVADLKKMTEKIKKMHNDPVLGYPEITVTSINAGNESSPNKFAGICRIGVDVRTTPSMHGIISEEIDKLIAKNKDSFLEEIGYSSSPAKCDDDQPIVYAMKKFITDIEYRPFPGATDLSFFNDIGLRGVVFGPGEVSSMHSPDEWIELGKMHQCFEYLKSVVMYFAD